MDGFSDDVIVAALVVWTTTWFNMGDALLELLASPLYTAISGYGSALRFFFVRVAIPLLSKMAVPIVKRDHVKATFPVGMPVPTSVAVTDVAAPCTLYGIAGWKS